MKYVVKLLLCLCVCLLHQSHLEAKEPCDEYELKPEEVKNWQHVIPPREDLGRRLELRRNLKNSRGVHRVHIKSKRNKEGKYVPYEWSYYYKGVLCIKFNDGED